MLKTSTKYSTFLLLFLLCGCGIGSVIATISNIAQAGVSAASADGVLSPTEAAYFDAGLACSAAAAVELATTDTAAQEAEKIAVECAGAATMVIPSTLTGNLLGLAQQQKASINKLIPAQVPMALNPSETQKTQLAQIRANIVTARAKLRGKGK